MYVLLSKRRFGVDPFRYFLLSTGRIDADNDFSEAKVSASVNELANTLGNLQLRCGAARTRAGVFWIFYCPTLTIAMCLHCACTACAHACSVTLCAHLCYDCVWRSFTLNSCF
jgi:hypothetical protein